MTTRHLTIMFTDIKGFTARVSDSSRDDLNSLLERHAHLLQPVFKHFGGTVIKEIGDAFLVRFDSATNAVMCGVAIQEVLRQHNETVAEDDRLHVRVAINAGDVEFKDGDILGEPVNIAARLEAIAEPGEVFFTEAVYLTMNRKEAPAAAVGEHTFKGIPYPVKVFSVVQPDNSPLRQRVRAGVKLTPRGPDLSGFQAASEPARRRRGMLVAILLIAVVCAGLLWWARPTPGERALRDARAASDPATALDIAAVGLAAEPEHKELRALAIAQAEKRLAQLRAKSGRESLAWLRTEIERRPFLEPLRARVPELEAEEAAEADKPYEACLGIARRYENSVAVPLAAARRLRKLDEPSYALSLYQIALKRGHKGGDEVFDWITELYGVYPAGRISPAERIVQKHFAERWDAWTREQLGTTDNPRLFDNLVVARKDLPGFDPYYRSLSYCLMTAVSNELHEQALKEVLADKDPQRRAQAIALHEAIVKQYPDRRSGKRCAAALERLR